MFVKDTTNPLDLLKLDKSYQVFLNKGLAVNPDIILRMAGENRIKEVDIDLAHFLYKVRFAHKEQIRKYLELREGKAIADITLNGKIEKLIRYRIYNVFQVSTEEEDKYEKDNSLLNIYCLDTCGRSLVINYTDTNNWWDWKYANNYKSPSNIAYDLVLTDFYLRLLTTNLISFSKDVFMNIGKGNFLATARATVKAPTGKENVIFMEVVFDDFNKTEMREILDKYDFFLNQEKNWGRYADSPPILFFICENDKVVEDLMELTKKTLIENHRFTTIERMKLPLHSPGALVKLSPTATIQNVSSSYLSKELIEEG